MTRNEARVPLRPLRLDLRAVERRRPAADDFFGMAWSRVVATDNADINAEKRANAIRLI
jgi:hypothetical protein